ncbi:MAG: ricin-type beta-trefoil lectin domain protein [Proteobacteria bacterium]|nr:ricin-type beta-trefoil lectin domain protein [Pseudomonadota bacterium]MCP4918554.1 ricin-type beta-trefoil lectin domain protein [Pseudomonadota bacterium]
MLVLLLACNGTSTPVAETHFDPPSGTTITDDDSYVSVIGLDDEAVVCFTVDGSDPDYDVCENVLTTQRDIPLGCGFQVVKIAWASGDEEANYLVENTVCEESAGPVVLWANDELVWAFDAIKVDLQCRMNDCENPSGIGNWDVDCDSGSVDWNVSLDGVRAISKFTYNSCAETTTIDVHDYVTDPWFQDETATVPLDVTITIDGKITQDTDFSGNGSESGTVSISGDFVGAVESSIEISSKERSGGGFSAGCSEDPLDEEICAPAEAMILYDWPDWTCHGSICPEPGDEPPESDGDGDGVDDAEDNCPDDVNPLQEDIDDDGIGDACDDDPGFSLIQFKTGERCLYVSGSDVGSTTECGAEDQQWIWFENGSSIGLKSLLNAECLTWSGSSIGPYDVVTAACSESDDNQKWDLEEYDQGGLDEAWPTRLHNVGADFCIYTDGTGWVYGTAGNCSLAGTDSGRKMGLYLAGDFDSEPVQP